MAIGENVAANAGENTLKEAEKAKRIARSLQALNAEQPTKLSPEQWREIMQDDEEC